MSFISWKDQKSGICWRCHKVLGRGDSMEHVLRQWLKKNKTLCSLNPAEFTVFNKLLTNVKCLANSHLPHKWKISLPQSPKENKYSENVYVFQYQRASKMLNLYFCFKRSLVCSWCLLFSSWSSSQDVFWIVSPHSFCYFRHLPLYIIDPLRESEDHKGHLFPPPT